MAAAAPAAEVVQGDYELSDNTSFSLSDADRAAGVVLLCSAFIQEDELVIDVSPTMDDLSEDQYLAGQHVQEYLATVDQVEALTHDIRWLGLRLEASATFTFTAGQSQ
jgi:alkene monooxygenase reductase